jgi:hypothetical protein
MITAVSGHAFSASARFGASSTQSTKTSGMSRKTLWALGSCPNQPKQSSMSSLTAQSTKPRCGTPQFPERTQTCMKPRGLDSDPTHGISLVAWLIICSYTLTRSPHTCGLTSHQPLIERPDPLFVRSYMHVEYKYEYPRRVAVVSTVIGKQFLCE